MFEATVSAAPSSVASSLPKFVAGQPAARVDLALRQALCAIDRAQERAVLWFAEVARRSLFHELGHASLELYAVNGLGFSRNRYFQFKRLADDLERLPRLRAAVAAGRIGWTKAQQVARVATPASEQRWIEEAAKQGLRGLAESVKQTRVRARARRREAASNGQLDLGANAADLEADPPVTVSFRLDGVQLARFEALVERTRKRGVVRRGASREEILLTAMQMLAESDAVESDGSPAASENQTCTDPDPQSRSETRDMRLRRRNWRAPAQVIVRRCPECERTAVVTSRGDRELSKADGEAACCDAEIHEEGPRRHSTVPSSVRAAVMERDGHRCRAEGCSSTGFLEVHHVVPRSEGGSNKPENLITLCSRCHRFAHESTCIPRLPVTASTPPACARAAG